MISLTQETLNHWEQFAQQHLHHVKTMLTRNYEESKQTLITKYNNTEALEQAIAARYLFLPDRRPKSILLKRTFQYWCMTQTIPMLIIEPRGTRSVCIDFDLESVQPWGAFNLYQPTLNENDETFRLMMLLAREYSYSQGHVFLERVSKKNAEEVARQILAYYDRSLQIHLKQLEATSQKL